MSPRTINPYLSDGVTEFYKARFGSILLHCSLTDPQLYSHIMVKAIQSLDEFNNIVSRWSRSELPSAHRRCRPPQARSLSWISGLRGTCIPRPCFSYAQPTRYLGVDHAGRSLPSSRNLLAHTPTSSTTRSTLTLNRCVNYVISHLISVLMFTSLGNR